MYQFSSLIPNPYTHNLCALCDLCARINPLLDLCARIKPLLKGSISADFGIYFARRGIYINEE